MNAAQTNTRIASPDDVEVVHLVGEDAARRRSAQHNDAGTRYNTSSYPARHRLEDRQKQTGRAVPHPLSEATGLLPLVDPGKETTRRFTVPQLTMPVPAVRPQTPPPVPPTAPVTVPLLERVLTFLRAAR